MRRLKVFLVLVVGLMIFSVQANGIALPVGLHNSMKSGLDQIGINFNSRSWSEQQKLSASDGITGDRFGLSVASEGNTLVIGASGVDIDENNSQGAAYVFVYNGQTWIQQAKLAIADPMSSQFGASVALSGNTLVIGAIGDSLDEVVDRGAVYVFVRNGDTWTQQAKLIPVDGMSNDNFGQSVAIDGDTILVGTSRESFGAPEQISVYVYVRDGEIWSQQAQLNTGELVDDDFGQAVALDGNTALIGAQGSNARQFQQGAAFVFVRDGVTWTQQAFLTANDGGESDLFGSSVTLEGDTALIGAYGDTLVDGDIEQGSAYVFARTGETWSQQAKLVAHDGDMADLLGLSVALEGDVALVGAPGDRVGQDRVGSAYIFMRNGTTWSQYVKLLASDGEYEDKFGWSVTLEGEIALIGAWEGDVGSVFNPGAAYVFANLALLPGALIQNGGFENLGGDGKPDVTPWTIKNASGDKAKCNKDKDGDGVPDKIFAHAGNCAFQFKNVVSEAGKIQQTLDLSAIVPAVGDGLNLSFFTQSKGGATAKVKVVFKYADDTKTKISIESGSSEDYAQSIGGDTLTSTDIAKAKINIKSSQTSGKVYVDDVSLLHVTTVSGTTETPTPGVTATEPPPVRLSGSKQ